MARTFSGTGIYVLVKPGTQIDSAYYWDELLLQPAIRSTANIYKYRCKVSNRSL